MHNEHLTAVSVYKTIGLDNEHLTAVSGYQITNISLMYQSIDNEHLTAVYQSKDNEHHISHTYDR